MREIEKAELVLITISFVVFLLLRPFFPMPSTLGTLILTLSSLLLFQGLIRDLTYLLRNKKQASNVEQSQTMFGLCVESSIGILGVVVGIVVIFFLGYGAYSISYWLWSSLVLSVFIFGFLIKDYVIDFTELKIHKDVEHMNIIVARKKVK